MKKTNVVRLPELMEKLVVVDGFPGCGKSMMSAIISSLDRVEIMSYSPEIENVCTLRWLDKMTGDAAIALIRVMADLLLNNVMMSRDVNLRFGDLSGIWKNPHTMRYLSRLFQKGNDAVPDMIKELKPIFQLVTHQLLAFSEPLFKAFGDKVFFIEVVRHPLYVIKQQALNWDRIFGTARHFHVYNQWKDQMMPITSMGREKLYEGSNSLDKTIYDLDRISELTKMAKNEDLLSYYNNIFTIPFERFVIDPDDYMSEIAAKLSTQLGKKTKKVMKQQNVPRAMLSDGIDLSAYRKCGWEPPVSGSTQAEEYRMRWEYAETHASKKGLDVLMRLCEYYEKKYLGGKFEY